MKKSGQCPKCAGQKIGRFHRLTDFDGKYADKGRVLGHDGESGFDANTASVEAYVCTECGFFEEYVKAPDSVAWGALSDFSWL